MSAYKTKPLTKVLCCLSDLEDGQARGFDPFKKGHDTVFVVRRSDKVYAYLDVCPHYGSTPLPWKKNAYLTRDAQHIFCSAHGATFDIETGTCTLGPCVGQSLTSVQVAISQAGEIRLFLEPGDGPIRTPVATG
ncbi:(2Fe-2S)-binding protein [Bradyrhizobium sp. AC87j1]|uniref:Rieske (2Fe-2S) protein n=1 Tax=Bradyrhizobium sp. AC87j1 TaxID=2055894 RepID=UPI000CEC6678|nr:Rieske 2Fe-2S domain-containing protein [Bradyrhizobium sp. AC87j1]PPQ16431.1 (2Fe-2S)-binding protein [Bradyrhizobium sp. AC87j1]